MFGEGRSIEIVMALNIGPECAQFLIKLSAIEPGRQPVDRQGEPERTDKRCSLDKFAAWRSESLAASVSKIAIN